MGSARTSWAGSKSKGQNKSKGSSGSFAPDREFYGPFAPDCKFHGHFAPYCKFCGRSF
jgi:hypothetical protein